MALAALDAGGLDDFPTTMIASARRQIGEKLDAQAADLLVAIAAGDRLDEAELDRVVAIVKKLAETLQGETAHG